MAAPILTEAHISEVSQTIRNKQIGINRVEFVYKKEQLYIDAFGVEGIPQADTYYENIEDHLVYSEFSWLGPLCRNFKVNLDATINVDPEGEFEQDSIELGVYTAFSRQNSKPQILNRLMPLLNSLVPFRSHLSEVELVWHDGCLNTIRFFMNIDAKKVNPIISNAQAPNNQVLRQWVSTIDQAIDYNKGRYKHRVKLPIVNGRINIAKYETAVCFRLEVKGKK